jgi:hypothetical protein
LPARALGDEPPVEKVPVEDGSSAEGESVTARGEG